MRTITAIVRHLVARDRKCFIASDWDACWSGTPNAVSVVWTHPIGRGRYFVAYE